MQSAADILEADHAELHVLLERTFSAIRGRNLTASYAATDLFWARLAMHIRAEHLHLFPLVRERGDARILGILDELRHDHDMFMTELARAIKALRLAFHFGNEEETLVTVRQLVERVADRLKIHDEVEERKIYPLVADTMRGADGRRLSEGIIRELQNYPQRFGGD
jgi:iron-sulfur cluster repair protein YtfE (RIC family)